MNKRFLAILISGATLLVSAAGCNNSKGVATANGSNAANNNTAATVTNIGDNAAATAAVSPTPTQPAADGNLGTVATTVPAPTNAAAVASSSAAKNGARGAQSAKAPQPQVGSGGNDLFLFTQVRGSINSDGALKNSGIVVDVKDGNVVLSGSVADESQRSKAEQIAKSVGGVKSVRNGLRVGKGGAAK